MKDDYIQVKHQVTITSKWIGNDWKTFSMTFNDHFGVILISFWYHNDLLFCLDKSSFSFVEQLKTDIFLSSGCLLSKAKSWLKDIFFVLLKRQCGKNIFLYYIFHHSPASSTYARWMFGFSCFKNYTVSTC